MKYLAMIAALALAGLLLPAAAHARGHHRGYAPHYYAAQPCGNGRWCRSSRVERTASRRAHHRRTARRHHRRHRIAHVRHHQRARVSVVREYPCGKMSARWCTHARSAAVSRGRIYRTARARIPHADPRPGKWCAWWLRRKMGIPRSAFRPGQWNRAAAFRHIGRAATRATANIVVWPHHVGKIDRYLGGNRAMITSGNDGHRVRTRVRSLRGAIAFRYWSGWQAARL